MELFGKIAIVTGGAGAGSGQAIARRLAIEGASVIVADINEDVGRAIVHAIEADGGRAVFLSADVRREAEVRTLVTSEIDPAARRRSLTGLPTIHELA